VAKPRKLKEWGGSPTNKQTIFPRPKVCKNIIFIYQEPFKDKAFLHQKYVLERLSIAEIAKEIFSAESTVHKYLRQFEIPIRDPGSNIRRKRALAYGRRIEDRREVAHQRELEVIDKMRSLRDQGFSYWKIADVLNAMKVPTKTRKGRWHARSVQQILDFHNGETRPKSP
jgi:hypothetical protein